MRPPVPFIGEELILRDGEHPGETTSHGQLINEVMSTAGENSS